MNPVLRARLKLHFERLSRNCAYTAEKEHINLNAWRAVNGYSTMQMNEAKEQINCQK